MRIAFSTGSNLGNRKERLKIGNTGDIAFNNNQMHLRASDGFIGMGTTAPKYKLHVTNDSSDGTIYAENYYSGYYEGVAVRALADNGKGHGIGVSAIGGYTGVQGWAHNDLLDNRSGGATGVSGWAVGSKGIQHGVKGQAEDTSADGQGHTYGVFGMAKGDGFVAAGYFQGEVFANNYYYISDRKFKTSIKPVDSALEGIMKLRPASYEFKTEEYKNMNLPKGRHLGLIAQELKEVFPDLVKEAVQPAHLDNITLKEISPEVKYQAVNYQGLIPVLVATAQEQQGIIEKQQKQIEKQQQQIDELKAMVNRLVQGSGAVPLSNVSLGTATPNPASGSAIVSYILPEGSRTAHIVVMDIKGSIIKQVNLSGKGSGQLQLNTSSLAVGTYTYSLFVDGSKVDTKQLLVVR